MIKKNVLLRFFISIFMAGVIFQALYAGPVSENGKLSVNGLQLVNDCGNAVQLKGISSHGLQWFGMNGSDSSCLNSSAISYMADTMGADLFRAAVYVESNGYLSDPQRFRDEVDQLVDICEGLGIYIIIDWHILSDGNPLTNLSAAQGFWEYMAQQHAGKDHVLYEICNEPNGDGGSWSNITEYANDIIPRIRQYDPDTVILVGTPNWSQLGWDVVNSPLPYSNIMYSFHFYAASHTTGMLTDFINEIPIFCTEWGTCDASGGDPYDFNNAQAFLDIMAGNNSAG
ncbi:MAG: glycoside hydrolase family 5 protein, partial [bacterium]